MTNKEIYDHAYKNVWRIERLLHLATMSSCDAGVTESLDVFFKNDPCPANIEELKNDLPFIFHSKSPRNEEKKNKNDKLKNIVENQIYPNTTI